MEQLTQKLGSGEMVIQELPMPQLTSGMVSPAFLFSFPHPHGLI